MACPGDRSISTDSEASRGKLFASVAGVTLLIQIVAVLSGWAFRLIVRRPASPLATICPLVPVTVSCEVANVASAVTSAGIGFVADTGPSSASIAPRTNLKPGTWTPDTSSVHTTMVPAPLSGLIRVLSAIAAFFHDLGRLNLAHRAAVQLDRLRLRLRGRRGLDRDGWVDRHVSRRGRVYLDVHDGWGRRAGMDVDLCRRRGFYSHVCPR